MTKGLMKLIPPEEREKLEEKLGIEICPVATKGIRHIGLFGVYKGAEEQRVYGCNEGGRIEQLDTGLPAGMNRPCSMEYAKKCPTYREANLIPMIY